LFDNLLCIRNTRYGWLVRPYPAGTRTPQETPSFAWRTHPYNVPSPWVLLSLKITTLLLIASLPTIIHE
ncbi:MAG: hypothetical protein ACLP5H_14510, partial [Desulfomonilaceae bacterium]